MALTEVYEVATFYSHFDVVKEGETPPPAVTVRVCDLLVLRHGRRRDAARRSCPSNLGKDVRVVRAPCMGACDRAPVVAVGHVQTFQADAGQGRRRGEGQSACARLEAGDRFRRLSESRRLCAAEGLPRRQAHARRTDQDRQRCRPARPRRRRLSDRAQMVAGARGTGAAAVRGQCRRRRARHLQGSLLSRARSAPLHRRHADRRLGGRGRRHLSLHPRRISRTAADAGARRSPSAEQPGCRRTPSCICAAAPAPTSAAKSRR